ncbi:hypothetical protein G6F37_002450 [Rhizopus arrhizus]|nr:hypothetical protein G6F37_002450 [Rhizopus arrhizus]
MSVDTFSTAISYWNGIQLPNLQKELDQQGLTIVENQKDGLVSRKKLAEQTREFKKIPDEEKLQKIKPLLKAYQTEIDNITKRTKYSENSFLSVYKLLADAPDPAPLFEAAIDQSTKIVDISVLQNENTILKEQLDKANKQLASLEKTNSELAKKSSSLESLLNEKKDPNTIEQEIRDQYNDRIRQYKEREYDLQKQLNQALDQLTQLKQSHDDTQAQLINHSQKYGKIFYYEEVAGKLAELDIVIIDLERANTKIIQLEKIISDLKENNSKSLEITVESQSENEAEISRLIKDVEAYRDILQKTEARLSKKIKELTANIAKLDEENDQLKRKLKNFDDYDEIKRELQIMKACYVEFSTGEEEFNANEVLNKEVTKDRLEVQLMEKNKKLETEYTQIKVSYADIKKENEGNLKLIEELNTKITEKTKLIQRLEEDLLRLGQKTDQADVLSRNSSTSNLATMPNEHTPRQSMESIREDKSILPIVMSQRDRFRQKNAELEDRARSLETTLQDMRMEVQNLKKDNLKLYERLKFVHVWKEGQQERNNHSVALNMDSSFSAGTPTRHFRKSSIKIAEDPTDKYSKLYEESMNPFTQFHRKEENRRYNALNPAEKFTLNLTRVLFSHRWSRYFFIVYSLLLHLLVVITLYQLSLWECRHDHEALNFPTNNDDAKAILSDINNS